jgi:hypothetical protein
VKLRLDREWQAKAILSFFKKRYQIYSRNNQIQPGRDVRRIKHSISLDVQEL